LGVKMGRPDLLHNCVEVRAAIELLLER